MGGDTLLVARTLTPADAALPRRELTSHLSPITSHVSHARLSLAASRSSRRYYPGDDRFEIRRFNLAPLGKIIRPVLDQHNPTKGRP